MNKTDSLPRGIVNAYWFQAFNTMSFSLVNGSLMVLYFKNHGATATILGILASLAPFLNILQIPAAFFVERTGYRAFVLKGWTLRCFAILLLAGVVFLPTEFENHTRITLMLFLLAAYNALRGISVCGFLPWISRLVPESIMGKYLAMDQISMGLASVTINFSVAVLLLFFTSPYAIGYLLLFSFTSGIISLSFLRRMPDVPVNPESSILQAPGWKEIVLYPPFFRLLRYNIVVNLALGASAAFWPAFMRDVFHASDTYILLIVAATVFMMVTSLLIFGRRIDRVGSRPILFLSGFCYTIHFLGWFIIGSNGVPFSIPAVAIQCVTAGLASSLYNIAITRLAMGTMPEHGKSHFFAYFSVINNLVLGLSPVLWGLILDFVKGWEYTYFQWRFTRYSLLYVSISTICVSAVFFLRKVREPKAMALDVFLHELIIESPRKVLTQVFPRWLP